MFHHNNQSNICIRTDDTYRLVISLTKTKLELNTLSERVWTPLKILYWLVFTSCSRPANHVLFHPLFFVISGSVINRKWRGVSVWPHASHTLFFITCWVESQPFCNCNFAKCALGIREGDFWRTSFVVSAQTALLRTHLWWWRRVLVCACF